MSRWHRGNKSIKNGGLKMFLVLYNEKMYPIFVFGSLKENVAVCQSGQVHECEHIQTQIIQILIYSLLFCRTKSRNVLIFDTVLKWNNFTHLIDPTISNSKIKNKFDIRQARAVANTLLFSNVLKSRFTYVKSFFQSTKNLNTSSDGLHHIVSENNIG